MAKSKKNEANEPVLDEEPESFEEPEQEEEAPVFEDSFDEDEADVAEEVKEADLPEHRFDALMFVNRAEARKAEAEARLAR